MSLSLLRPNYEMHFINNDDVFRGLAKTAFHGAMSLFHSLVTSGCSLVSEYLSNLKPEKVCQKITENSLSVKSTPGFWWIMQMILHPS